MLRALPEQPQEMQITPGSRGNVHKQPGQGVVLHDDGACRRTQPPPAPEASSPGSFHLPARTLLRMISAQLKVITRRSRVMQRELLRNVQLSRSPLPQAAGSV